MKNHYVYILRRPCGEPFYVGKGTGERILKHERQARRSRANCHRLNIIRKILASGGEVVRDIESWHDDNESACEREKQLIAILGRIELGTGPLVNQTDGGDGGLLGPIARKRHREAMAVLWNDPEFRQKMADAARYERRPEIRKRIAESMANWNRENPELAQQYKNKRAETIRSDRFREQSSLVGKRRFESKDERDKAAARTKRYFDGHPEARAAKSRILSERFQKNPSLKAEIAERKRMEYSQPGPREHLSLKRKKWNRENPEAFAENERKRLAGARSPEARAKNAQSKRLQFQSDPKYTAMFLASVSTPEAKVRHAEGQRRRFQDPAERAKIRDAKAKFTKARGEIRDRCLAAVKKHKINVPIPDGRVGIGVWEVFEAMLASLVQEKCHAQERH